MKPTSTGLAPAGAPPTAATTAADDRSTAFRPVEGGNEMQSGEKLLVEAYAAMWVLLFALLLLWWRRQRITDERISNLEQAVMQARSDAAKASAARVDARADARAREAAEKASEARDA